MSLIDRLRNAASETERPIVSLEFLAANEIESLRQQLAECQATNLQMRGLVDQFLVENDTTEFGCACHPGEGYVCGTCRAFDRQLPLRQALALPNDATALNELIAERTKEAVFLAAIEMQRITQDHTKEAPPIPEELSIQIERTDWTPKEALQFYADQRNFDIVSGRARIIDNGAIASNALKHLDIDRLELKGDAELSELRQQNAELTAELQSTCLQMITDFGQYQEAHEKVKELTAEVERLNEVAFQAQNAAIDLANKNAEQAKTIIRLSAYININEQLNDQAKELTAQRDAAMKYADRYRWLRSEHAINDPMAAVVWKRNYDRKEHEWVNTSDVHSLDRAIDAAIANCKEPDK